MSAAVLFSKRPVKCKDCGVGDLWWWHEPDAPRGKIWTMRSEDGKLNHECAPRAVGGILAGVTEQPKRVAWDMTQEDLMALVPAKSVEQSYIPRQLNGSTDIQTLERAVNSGQNVLLVGETGTGKSHLAEATASRVERPLVAISGNAGITVEDFVGMNTLDGGKTVWVDGVLPRLMKAGGILVVDEGNAIPHEITFSLHQAMDWRRTLVITGNGGEVVVAHPAFTVIMCINPDYRGTKPLNEAFHDRFTDGLILFLDYDPQVERKLIKDQRLLAVAHQLRQSYREAEMVTPTSTRALMGYERNVLLHGEVIARHSFLSRYPVEERTAVRSVLEVVLDKPSGQKI